MLTACPRWLTLAVLFLLGGGPFLSLAPAGEPGSSSVPVPAETELLIEVDESATQPTLLIPRHLLEPGATAASAPSSSLSLPTILAGVALSVAFVSAGCWLARRQRAGGRNLAATGALVLGISLAVAAAGAVWADIRIGPNNPKPAPAPAPEPTPAPPQVQQQRQKVKVVQTPDRGGVIRLILPRGKSGVAPKLVMPPAR